MKHAERSQHILKSAMKLATSHGYENISRDSIAVHAGVSAALVSHYFGTMKLLRRAIIGEAIRARNLTVLMQGIVAKDRRACSIADDLRREVIESMMS